MNIVIIGGGSTGLVFGGLISEVTNTKILVRRKESARAINEGGVIFDIPGGDKVKHFPFASDDVSILQDADFIISLTKAIDAQTISETIKKNSRTDAMVLPLHNGLGSQEIYADLLGNDRMLMGTQYLIANRTSDNEVIFGANVRIFIGDQYRGETPFTKDVVEILNDSGFDAKTSGNVMLEVWNKFQIAVCQHALSAINNMTFGELFETAHVREIQKELNDEFQNVANAEGIDFGDEVIFDRVLANMQRGGIHKSSMCQDILAGRKTEIDFINGAISRLGLKHGISTPANDAIVKQIKALETK